LGGLSYDQEIWSTINHSPKEKQMALVLSIGTDGVLGQTRKLILELAGHSVISVTDEKSLASSCELYTFDGAVLGQALSANMKRRAADLVTQHCPNVKLLELHFRQRSLDDVDSWLQVPAEEPQELAKRVTQLSKLK
jgi:hypothetical protein